MNNEIINRVAKSKLVTFDLENFYPEGNRVLLDVKDWLYEGLILREKDFRAFLKNHDWSQYQNSYVAISCSTDAIIPDWAFMLVSLHLEPYAKHNVLGDLAFLDEILFQEIINTLDVSNLKNRPIIIKGCSKKPVPKSAYIMLMNKLKPIAKSIMYGEACSNVPLFKRK